MDYNIGTVTICIYYNGLMDSEKPCYKENIGEIKWSSTYTRQICQMLIDCRQHINCLRFYPDINVKFLFYCILIKGTSTNCATCLPLTLHFSALTMAFTN